MDAIDLNVNILQSAKRLELPADSQVVRDALETARIAVECGFSSEISLDLAREVLIRGAQLCAA